MKRDHTLLALILACALVCALGGVAYANPFGKLKGMFDDGLDLFLTGIIPGLAIAVIAWTGIMIGLGRKNLVDSVVVLAGAGLALFAGPIVASMRP